MPGTEGIGRSSTGWSRGRPGGGDRDVSAPRLADQPPALLGHADPGHLLRDARHRPRPRRGLPVLLPDTSTTRAAARTRSTATSRSSTRLPALRRARPAARPTRWTRSSTRPGTGSATCRRTRPTRRSTRTWSSAGARRPVHRRRRARRHAPDVRPLLHEGDVATSASSRSASRSCGCSTRARSWAPTASE